uniref:SF4 helicase domain-containing protein n=1 Tax=Rhabditophanes sp. KR3021 TaxID=114890 RepID=A0AC35UGK0_9BILA
MLVENPRGTDISNYSAKICPLEKYDLQLGSANTHTDNHEQCICIHVTFKGADRLSARGTPRDEESQFEQSASRSEVAPLTKSTSVNDLGSFAAADPEIRLLWNESMELSDIPINIAPLFRVLRAQLGIDTISAETLRIYNIRAHFDSYDHTAIFYPRYRKPTNASRPPEGLKVVRQIKDNKMEKENFPNSSKEKKFSGIFGFHLASPSDTTIMITTNERDALAVYDATDGMLAISLPQGEKMDYSILPYLERFETIYIWFPSVHHKFAKDYAVVLNTSRCFVVLAQERPIELMRDNRSKAILHAIHDDSLHVRHRAFKSLVDIRDDVKSELLNNTKKAIGFAQWKRFEALNPYLGGLRPGELTVFTGGSGYGKTTFLCEYSMDLFTQGVRTLFCSFEMPEEKILKWMLVQYAGPAHIKSLSRCKTYNNGIKIPIYRVENHPSVDQWIDRFEKLKSDIMFLSNDQIRNKTISEIFRTIEEHILRCGFQHIVIDNLQFMMGMATLSNDKSNSYDQYQTQDRFVGLLRSLATNYNVHVTLVVHPRKHSSDATLELADVGGTGRVTQEADNVYAITRKRTGDGKVKKYLTILKSRYGGSKRCSSDHQLELVFQQPTYTHIIYDSSLPE